MKIAIIASGFLPVVDGVTVSGFHRLQRLSKWGHEVLLFCPDYQPLKEVYPNWQDYTGEILPGVRVVSLESTPFFDLDFERNVGRRSYKTLWAELETFQPDIIHVDEPERLFLGFLKRPGLDYGKKYNIPCLGFFRTNFIEYVEDFFPVKGFLLKALETFFQKLIAWVYNGYDRTLIHSQITEKKLIAMGINNVLYQELWGFEAERFHDHLGEEVFFQNHYQLPQVDRLVKILFVGRLTPDKGWDFAFEGLKKAAAIVDFSKVAIIVAGDGPLKSEIQTQLSALTPHTHLLGRVDPDGVPALFANGDIYITNSEKENRALTVVEALASGLPSLVPNAGGVVENMTNGKTGFIYEPQNADDFAEKLKQLVENPEMRDTMAHQCRQDVAHLTLDQAVKNLITIWEEAITHH